MDNHASNVIYEGSYTVSTFAGIGGDSFLSSFKRQAQFDGFCDVAVDKHGDIYVADSWNHRLQKITIANGLVETVAGTGQVGFKDGPAHQAKLACPRAIVMGHDREVFFADGDRVRVYSPVTQTVRSLAVDDAALSTPWGIAVAANGSVLLCDSGNHRVVKIQPRHGLIEPAAGNGREGYADGEAHNAQFRFPTGVAVSLTNDIYVADWGNHCLRKIDGNTGAVSTVAGTETSGWRDGAASAAQFNCPTSVAIGPNGCIYISEDGNHCIRKVDLARQHVVTIAGAENHGFCDGDGETARFFFPQGLSFGRGGVLYVADLLNNRLRSVTRLDTAEPECLPNELKNSEETSEKTVEETNERTDKVHHANISTRAEKMEPELSKSDFDEVLEKLKSKTQQINGLAQKIDDVTTSTLAAREELKKTKDATIDENRALVKTQDTLKAKRLELQTIWEQRKAEVKEAESMLEKMEKLKKDWVAELLSVADELITSQTVLSKVAAEKTQCAEELKCVEAELERRRNAGGPSTAIVSEKIAGACENDKSEHASASVAARTNGQPEFHEEAKKSVLEIGGITDLEKSRVAEEDSQGGVAARTQQAVCKEGKRKENVFLQALLSHQKSNHRRFGRRRVLQHSSASESQDDKRHSTTKTCVEMRDQNKGTAHGSSKLLGA